ncbi:hypothetical protein GDO78_009051 [Eleutherodactylus coqui]|uniref:Hydroxypyruvate isomerase n=1 Tax=Eleutherodactylus coqui TaxID=57060 RepID=A0A8J6K7P5_ELECQ|nr:hypothetical protein GDO78_009051 [Eleutherodactylus coqui]
MPPPPLRFAANVSWLFPDVPDLPGRIVAAGRAGFRAVEVAWPYAADRGALKAALRAGAMELVLMNTPAGDREPGRPVLLGYRIHIMAGRVPAHVERSSIEKEMEETFIENLRYAADILNQVSGGVRCGYDGGRRFYVASPRDSRCHSAPVISSSIM